MEDQTDINSIISFLKCGTIKYSGFTPLAEQVINIANICGDVEVKINDEWYEHDGDLEEYQTYRIKESFEWTPTITPDEKVNELWVDFISIPRYDVDKQKQWIQSLYIKTIQ